MPFKIPAYQQNFTLTLDRGLPVASVEYWGVGIPYMLVCPLCGMVSELPVNVQNGQEYTPICPAKTSHPHAFAAWLESHPGAADHTTVRLAIRGARVIPLDTETGQAGERLAA